MFDRRDFLASSVAAAGAATIPEALAQSTAAMLPIELVSGGAPRAFKMHPRIAILSYPIRFITAAEGKGGGSAGIYLTMNGPTEADFRALAQEARDDLASRIASTGKEAVPAAAMLAEPTVAALRKVPGNGRWDSGVLDPMGKRYWFITSSPDAPLLDGWGSINGSAEYGMINRMTVPSRALDAVAMIPNLILEFSTLSGSVNTGSKGWTAWAGGDILFGYKPFSWTYFMAGGKRSIEMVGGTFNPKGRVIISPTKIPGTVNNDAGPLPPAVAASLGRGRHAEFRPDMNAWRELVRMAYRGYNAALVQMIAKSIG